jgi:hypothetical protein
VTDARVERVPADKVRGREFLDQTERFLVKAQISRLTPESRVTLLDNAAMCACDAILQADGMRVTSGDDAHILRLRTAHDQLDHDTRELLESLDASRVRRNEASYHALFVAEASATDAHEATAEPIELARSLLGK